MATILVIDDDEAVRRLILRILKPTKHTLLEAEDATAMPAFAALVGLHSDDALAGFHLRRLLNGARGVRMQLE